jgi:hypothetical protein
MSAKRAFIDIQGDMWDVWHFVSCERDQEYNSFTSDFKYMLIINRTAVSRDYREKIYKFDDIEERDRIADLIKSNLKASANIHFLGEGEEGNVEDEFQA